MSKEIRLEIAERLKAARSNAGLSQGQVAALLKLQRPAISEIESGRRRVSAEEIRQFADIYGVTSGWLVDGSESAVDPTLELAARNLGKLKTEDLNNVIDFLKTLNDKKG